MATTKKKEKLIYIGPTLQGDKLVKYQVFINGLPLYLDDVFQSCPQIKKLFVPVNQLIEAEKQVKTAGTPLNKYYKLAMEV